MRGLPALFLLLAGLARADASDAPWTTLHRDGLTLQAPAGTTLERAGDAASWRLRNSRFVIGIDFGPQVGDGDDAEPALCYTGKPIVILGRAAVLRVAKENPRLDCPERYASLYLAAPGGDGLYVWGRGGDQDDLATIRAVLETLRIGR